MRHVALVALVTPVVARDQAMKAAYFFLVIFFATWPWNGWLLIVGAAYTLRLYRKGVLRRLLGCDGG